MIKGIVSSTKFESSHSLIIFAFEKAVDSEFLVE
jgi:hypothetical protein